MDQVQNSILQVMQAVAANTQSANKAGSGREEFRKLMEGQRRPDGNPAQAEANPKGEASQDGEVQEVLEDGDSQLQERILLAAAAMLQNPVVTQVQDPVEMTEVQETVETGAVELVTEAVQEAAPEMQEAAPETLAETELPKVSPDGTMRVRAGDEAVQETVETAETGRETVEKVEITRSQETGDRDEDQEETAGDGETAVFQDLKAVPVKVGEAEATEKAQEAKPVETQIGEKLTEALKSGETRVEIQLTPENLGKVTIEVTQHQDGSLRVTLHAELSQTRDLLSRDLGALQSALARNTQQDVRVEVQKQPEERNYYEGHQGHDQENQQQRQEKDRKSREESEDFLHQLRLGLIPDEGE